MYIMRDWDDRETRTELERSHDEDSEREKEGDVGAPGDGTDRVGRFFRASSMIPLPSVLAHAQPIRAMQSSQPHRPCLHSLGLLEAPVLQAKRLPMLFFFFFFLNLYKATFLCLSVVYMIVDAVYGCVRLCVER
jgi:hypothetical protein